MTPQVVEKVFRLIDQALPKMADGKDRDFCIIIHDDDGMPLCVSSCHRTTPEVRGFLERVASGLVDDTSEIIIEAN